MDNKKIFAFCFDKNYSSYCLVALTSLIFSNGTKIRVYCIFDGSVEDSDLEALKDLSKRFNFEINFIRANFKEFDHFLTWGHYTTACFLRLLLPGLLRNEEKVLYLDCDTIIKDDISELFEIDMTNISVAGVYDENAQAQSKINKIYKQNYINSGVMLMNLDFLRKDKFLQKVIKIYHEMPEKITFVDQCLINAYSKDSRLIIDQKYNRLVKSRLITSQEWSQVNFSAKILHFVESTKPWHQDSLSHVAEFWWNYEKLSGDNGIIENALHDC